MNTIHFNERDYAEELHNSQEKMVYKKRDLIIYAKWLKYKELQKLGKDYGDLTDDELTRIEKSIKSALIDFGKKSYVGFNYVKNWKDIDLAIETTRKYKLKLPLPLPITEKEWNVIQSIENENYRKVAFVMLVDAKYYRYFNTSLEKNFEIDDETVFYCQMDEKEQFKAANVKFKSKDEKLACFYTLNNLGLIGFKVGKEFIDFVKFVDTSNENIIDYITDYDHIDLHYDKLCGGKIGICRYCGSLFKQNAKNNVIYCFKHRGYIKKGMKAVICADCGKEFFVFPNLTNKIRCEDCQKIHTRNYNREWKEKVNSISALKD